MSIRAIVICRQFLPVANGTERQAAALARETMRQGAAVRVLSGRFDPKWPRSEAIGGLPVERLPSPRIRLLGTWIYLRALRSWLARHAGDYDIVHVHFAKHSAAAAARMRRRIGAPVVCKAACAGEFGDLAAAGKTFGSRRLLDGLMRLDRLIALSDEIAREWRDAGFPAERIACIPNGVDTERFRPASAEERSAARLRLGLPKDATVILGVGRLSEQKGFGFLIDAVADLAKSAAPRSAPLALAIAGDGPLQEPLRARAREKGIGGQSFFLGRIERIEEAYRAADAFALSSLAEGMSNALLEAMASGLPIAATRVSGTRELAPPPLDGALAEPGSVPALAAALRHCLSEEGPRIGASARERIAREFSLQAVAARTLELYRETIREFRGEQTKATAAV
ncbi:MAG: putative glycosyltransferase EpsF [candidate division BRC1 bacterium ADurb.BinA364]|nr:MAG: putative glycosyltransferase EpsF [candidate division BRC1 bacterium ADurb.BinA364]